MTLFRKLQLYWHTISHLKPEQIGHQVWLRMGPVRRGWEALRRSRKVESYAGCRVSLQEDWLPPPAGANDAESILRGQLQFVRESHSVEWPPRWDIQETSKLWQYNLFYFEWLWLLSAEDAWTATQDWIAFARENPRHTGSDPYPTSLRLINWCGVFLHKHREYFEQREDVRELLWESVCEQVEDLLLHLEYHLLGNHLFENAVALAVVGSCFEGERARHWLNRGVALLEKELQEQILPDGLHFELSPMYHLRVLYTMLLLAKHGDESAACLARPRLPKMVKALQRMCHPDRQISLFNDSAFGIYHTPEQLLSWYQNAERWKVARGAWEMSEAGYYGALSKGGNYVVCDAGSPGPDYIPGHAHGDIFSFEMSLRGQRVIVDSGVYDYVGSDMRRYCRSTQAHNTVTLDGVDQSEFWGAFRVARRGSPRDVIWQVTEDGFALQGWHDGYQRLSSKRALHERTFRWSGSGRLEVHDFIDAAQSVEAVSRLHLHPSCSVLSQTTHRAKISSPVGEFQIVFQGQGELLPLGAESSWYCSGFGCATPNDVLCFRAIGSRIHLSFVIE